MLKSVDVSKIFIFLMLICFKMIINLRNEYVNLILFLLITFFLFLLIQYTLNKLFSTKPTINKVTSYECGFEPFGDSRSPMVVQYYVIALIFLLFDIELIFMFP
jgi:NADH-quinone oxidoreductase subunit A